MTGKRWWGIGEKRRLIGSGFLLKKAYLSHVAAALQHMLNLFGSQCTVDLLLN